MLQPTPNHVGPYGITDLYQALVDKGYKKSLYTLRRWDRQGKIEKIIGQPFPRDKMSGYRVFTQAELDKFVKLLLPESFK